MCDNAEEELLFYLETFSQMTLKKFEKHFTPHLHMYFSLFGLHFDLQFTYTCIYVLFQAII